MPYWILSPYESPRPYEIPVALLSGFAAYTTFRLPIEKRWFDAHYERLKRDTERLGFDWSYTNEALHTEIIGLLQQDETIVVRITAYPEAAEFSELFGTQALPCLLLLSTRPIPTVPQKALSLQTLQYVRLLPNIKLAGIGELIQAKCAARNDGYDDILLLNHAGHITEASTANFFAFDTSGCLRTPDPLRDGCLPGITRQQILEVAKEHRIKVCREPLDIQEIPNFPGAFLTNAVQGLVPVKQIDTHELPWPKETFTRFEALQRTWH